VSLVIATGAEPQVTAVIAKRRSSKALPVTESRRPSLKAMRPPARIDATTDPGHPDRTQRMRQLRAAALEIKVQANIELLVKAAEDALRANDVVGAANNLRLALSHRDDPHLRKKYEEIDARARVVRFEKNMAPARAAERDERWADAAVFLLRAHEARPDADVAARAANALRLSGGDVERAIALAEQAVAFDARNVAYQLTLGEVYLAASRFASAEETSTIVQELAPKDPRGRELAAEIARKRRPASKR
jgi:tetratricopeptide (TPR) repeat protein